MSARKLRIAVALTCAVVAVGTGAGVFILKKDAERDATAIGELNRKIAAERQRISELRAEWSALDHPVRLQDLMERHTDVLDLAPIGAEQIVSAGRLVTTVRAKREEVSE
ncbi:MAG: cell division protein FtsL [Pseudomonadota bacterium]